MFLIELLFANCMNEIPEAAAETDKKNNFVMLGGKKTKKEDKGIIKCCYLEPDSPTRPNKTQYIAANIGIGIEAKNAPNFPRIVSILVTSNYEENSIWIKKRKKRKSQTKYREEEHESG